MSFVGNNVHIPTIFTLIVSIILIFNGCHSCDKHQKEVAIKNFRDYLRIDTSHFDPDYDSAIKWIQEQAKGLELKYNIFHLSAKKNEFVVWLTWDGLDPTLETIFLYSHIDVVTVDTEWKHDPFGAQMDSNGFIFGRGTQDMKSTAVQYLEAIRSLKSKGVTPNRTVQIGFVPDEELGSGAGIRAFVLTPQFKNLNVGFVLDEGLPTKDPTKYSVFYAQKQAIWPKFTAVGETGHGSSLLNNTAGEKILKVLNRFMAFAEAEKQKFKMNNSLDIGDLTTINLSILEGGIQANIIPGKFSAVFDIRFPPEDHLYTEMIAFFNETCKEAGPNVTYEIMLSSVTPVPVTKLTNDSWWWTGMQNAFRSMNLTIVPKVFPAGSDGQILRTQGIPTLGFSPIYNTTMLMHDRDEYLHVDVFLRGIEIYANIIQTLSFVPPATGHEHNKHDHEHKPSDKKNVDKAKSTANLLRRDAEILLICSYLVYLVNSQKY